MTFTLTDNSSIRDSFCSRFRLLRSQFGEEAEAATEVWILRACIVQGSQQIRVAAFRYWGDELDSTPPGTLTHWWIVWPLSVLSFLFVTLFWRGLPGKSPAREPVCHSVNIECRALCQTPPKVPNFYNTLLRWTVITHPSCLPPTLFPLTLLFYRSVCSDHRTVPTLSSTAPNVRGRLGGIFVESAIL